MLLNPQEMVQGAPVAPRVQVRWTSRAQEVETQIPAGQEICVVADHLRLRLATNPEFSVVLPSSTDPEVRNFPVEGTYLARVCLSESTRVMREGDSYRLPPGTRVNASGFVLQDSGRPPARFCDPQVGLPCITPEGEELRYKLPGSTNQTLPAAA